MKILLTGFDPFGGESINPAEESVKLVPHEILGHEIIKLIVPTTRIKCLEVLEESIKINNPDIVICVGQAGGRFDITPERVAINMDDFRIGDNEGNTPIDTKIYEDGENAYFSNLPIKSMVKHLNDNNIPSSVSNSAGTFVCNHIMYGLLYLINTKYTNIKGGFIHIPYMREQVINKRNMPYMELDMISKGLTLAIEACILNEKDIKIMGGEIC